MAQRAGLAAPKDAAVAAAATAGRAAADTSLGRQPVVCDTLPIGLLDHLPRTGHDSAKLSLGPPVLLLLPRILWLRLISLKVLQHLAAATYSTQFSDHWKVPLLTYS